MLRNVVITPGACWVHVGAWRYVATCRFPAASLVRIGVVAGGYVGGAQVLFVVLSVVLCGRGGRKPGGVAGGGSPQMVRRHASEVGKP